MNYIDKYLKYKIKYLEFENMDLNGGGKKNEKKKIIKIIKY